MFNENDIVRNLVDKKLPKGTEGTIAGIYGTELGCKVEFIDKDGYTIGVETYSFDELEEITQQARSNI